MRSSLAPGLAAAVLATAVASDVDFAGTCPGTSDPDCWDAGHTCRRCCDLRLGPTGDDSCWFQVMTFRNCCQGAMKLASPLVEGAKEACAFWSSWFSSGMDILTVPAAQLVTEHQTLRFMCPHGAKVLKLAMLAPEVIASGLPYGHEWFWELEGMLQLAVDIMADMFTARRTMTYSFFLAMHRLLAAAVTSEAGLAASVAGREATVVQESSVATVVGGRSNAHDRGHGGPATAATAAADAAARAYVRSWVPGLGELSREAGADLPVALRSVARAVWWQTAFDPGAVIAALRETAVEIRNHSYTDPVGEPATLSLPKAPLSCSIHTALALVAYADVQRHAEGVTSQQYRGSLRVVQRCLNDVTDRGPLMEALRQKPWVPLLLALDRLECPPWAWVDTARGGKGPVGHGPFTLAGGGNFNAVVIPARDFESSYMRAWSKFHCGEETKRAMSFHIPDSPGLLVDVGAYLGGCALWAATNFESVEAVAVEPYAAAAVAMRRSVDDNGLGSRVRVIHGCVHSDGRRQALRRTLNLDSRASDVPQPAWESASPDLPFDDSDEVVVCERLDSLLFAKAAGRRISVLRVHTSGQELTVVKSAEGLFMKGLVGSVVAHMPSAELTRLLWGWGFKVAVLDSYHEPQWVRSGDDVELAAVVASAPFSVLFAEPAGDCGHGGCGAAPADA